YCVAQFGPIKKSVWNRAMTNVGAKSRQLVRVEIQKTLAKKAAALLEKTEQQENNDEWQTNDQNHKTAKISLADEAAADHRYQQQQKDYNNTQPETPMNKENENSLILPSPSVLHSTPKALCRATAPLIPKQLSPVADIQTIFSPKPPLKSSSHLSTTTDYVRSYLKLAGKNANVFSSSEIDENEEHCLSGLPKRASESPSPAATIRKKQKTMKQKKMNYETDDEKNLFDAIDELLFDESE
ncbi:unnamed protein product, partial [Didymodactylos carnosus]